MVFKTFNTLRKHSVNDVLNYVSPNFPIAPRENKKIIEKQKKCKNPKLTCSRVLFSTQLQVNNPTHFLPLAHGTAQGGSQGNKKPVFFMIIT